MPAKPATTIFTTKAAAITAPSIEEPNQIIPTTAITMAKIKPFTSPTNTSRRKTRHTFALVKSLVAIARTATVKDCVPALPPMDATIGINTAKATIFVIAISNCAITIEAAIEVIKLTANHGIRCLVVSMTRSDSDPSPTPARRIMSSSCSSSRTAIASSMVIRPINRPSPSTTGAEIRWYWLKA